MADQDRRGQHRAAMLEQKRQVGGQRRSEREKQSEDHDNGRPSTPRWLPVRPRFPRVGAILPGSNRPLPHDPSSPNDALAPTKAPFCA
jgi:hypothetical protein